ADVAKKLVAEAFALGCALDEPGDIDELDSGGNDDGSFGKFCERLEARIGNGYNAEVRIDGAERIVGSLGFARARDRVEEGGLSDIRKPDNSGAQHPPHPRPLSLRERGVTLYPVGSIL